MKLSIIFLLSALATCTAFSRLSSLVHAGRRTLCIPSIPKRPAGPHARCSRKRRHLYALDPNGKKAEVLPKSDDLDTVSVTNGDFLHTVSTQINAMDQDTSNSRNNNSVTKLQYAAYDMTCAGIVGVITGIVVAYFKLSIESVRTATYSLDILDSLHNEVGAVLIPVAGGLVVGGILWTGSLSPGLRGTVSQVESMADTDAADTTGNTDFVSRLRQQVPLLRKTSAAVSTLGTGCSLGPEGPCVELGMGVARSCIDLYDRRPIPRTQSDRFADEPMNRALWNRILLSCGAAAGVSAGFDAPVAGVFFALEVMQSAFSDAIKERNRQFRSSDIGMKYGPSNEPLDTNFLPSAEGLFSSTSTLTPVLLSSVLSALCARSILGDHLTFNVAKFYALSSSPLLELPIYLLLGAICGCVAFAFSQCAKLSRSFFEGHLGPSSIRTTMHSISPALKPALGGLFCGVSALFYPQILFFGYETLNSILSNTVYIPTSTLLSLLFVKAAATAISIGSGLVGGTLAPALFLGGVTGASFHNVMTDIYHAAVNAGGFSFSFAIADLPSYAMVGSASVLAALFRAPLTASLLLFELSRDYDVILPIIASAGVGCVVADLLEDALIMNQPDESAPVADNVAQNQRRDKDSASWGDLSDRMDLTNEEARRDIHRLTNEATDR